MPEIARAKQEHIMLKPAFSVITWDNIGNTLTGVRIGANWRDHLHADDPAALDHAPTFAELFADYEVMLHECKTLEQVETHIADADFLIVHKEMLPADALRKGKKLRLIQHLGLDYRGIPMHAAQAMGVPVAATPLVNYIAVAEHNWAMILNHVKRMPQQRVYMQQRGYIDHVWGAPPELKIGLMGDLTLGLLGFGEIARPMARYAQAFDMKTLYWDARRFEELEVPYNVSYVDWDTLWSQSDILSVQIPIKPETHKIIGAREIGLMKPTALFVNTARGKLVDQPALVAALQARRIDGAALDVFYDEPLPADDPLHDLHEDLSYHVTLTPHSAWQGPWTWVRDSLNLWNNVLHILRGEPIDYQVG
jgi:phosphoglycerate dehydrogenase-like enzyme